VALGAKEVVAFLPMNPLRLVKKVGYITAPGHRVTALVTDQGILEKPEGEEPLVLTHYFGGDGDRNPKERVDQIRALCGWELKISPALKAVSPPTPEELMDIRIFDPKGYFL
jgi:glutaconate CoA-transferase subunit B